MEMVNQIISLTKKSPTEPFLLQFKLLDEVDAKLLYLPDYKMFLEGDKYEKETIQRLAPDTKEVMVKIFNSIESYPWEWDLNNKKLDNYGFDLYYENQIVKFSPTAVQVIKDHIGYEADRILSMKYTRPDFAYGPHLTKLSIELEKTSVLSELSIQLHSVQPVRIAGFVYEATITGEGNAMKLNLNELEITQSNETIVIHFGEPITAKRITLTLAQDSLKETIALKTSEANNRLKEIKEQLRQSIRAGEING